MKAFVAALLVMAVIAVGADIALEQTGFSTAEQSRTAAVRLGE